MITWQERELSERLRNEFEKRGFYQLGYMPTEFAPMPYGFRSRENCTKFLSILEEEYKYIAFKNMAVKTGTADEQTVSANMFVKLGSLRREPYPVAEITASFVLFSMTIPDTLNLLCATAVSDKAQSKT